jgi:hypothetical protein
MRRRGIRILGYLGSALLALSPFAFAQAFNQKPKSPTPDQLPGTQLIVWSEMQRPQPVPATSEEMYPATSQIQVLSGMVLTRGSDLFLGVAGGPIYRIANSDRKELLRAFAGKRVRISGNIEARTSVLHVLTIEQL